MSSALDEVFDYEIVKQIPYGKLLGFIDDLNKAIKDLEEMKKQAVFCQLDERAVKYQKHIHNAQENKGLMEDAIIFIESQVVLHGDIKPMFLN